MKISLITATYNSAATLRDTFESVLAQNYPNLEYIVIDGASRDNTLEIVKEYEGRLPIRCVSEPDKGIYDAMNKGVALATGEIVGILNSDDCYAESDALKKIAAAFAADETLDACYGDISFFDSAQPEKIIRFWKAGEYREKKLANGWIIPHPSFFVRRRIYQNYGAYRTDFRLAADYEFILKLLKIHHIKALYLPTTLVKMRVGGASSASLQQRIKGWQELRNAWTVNNLPIPPFFITRRILSKLKQFLQKK